MNEAVYLKSRNAGASKENLWVTSLNGLLRFFQFVSFISSSVMVTIHNHRFPRNSFALTELWTSATFQQAIVIVSVHCIPIEGSKDERVRHCWIEAPPDWAGAKSRSCFKYAFNEVLLYFFLRNARWAADRKSRMDTAVRAPVACV